MPPAGRIDSFCRMCGRQGHHRAGDAENLAVLRGDVHGADVRHLRPGDIALAPPARAAVSPPSMSKITPCAGIGRTIGRSTLVTPLETCCWSKASSPLSLSLLAVSRCLLLLQAGLP